jgi:multidrug efflux system outer membrane protein
MGIRPFLPPLLLALAAGCNLTPTYTRPAPPVPGVWPQADAKVEAGDARGRWQDCFPDPGLQAVIRLALANNRDLRAATLNVVKAEARYQIQRSQLLPSVGVIAASENYKLPSSMSTSGQASIVRENAIYVGVISWELDFFGRLRSLKDQVLNQYLATEQAQAAAQLSLVSAVAQAYLAYAADSESLQLVQKLLETQKASFGLVSASREAGVASDLDMKQAEGQMDAARVELARWRGQLAMDGNALDQLAGSPVPRAQLPADLASAGAPRDVTVGLPSEVLLRRPDILLAEYQLKAANASIGAARAAYFPTIGLTSSLNVTGVGLMSPQLSGLFKSGTSTWGFSPEVVAPIFAGGSLRAGLRSSKADRDLAVAQYESAIQAAFREVADGLIRRGSLQEQLAFQQSLVAALDEARRLSALRYQEGLDGWTTLLAAERNHLAARQVLVMATLACWGNQVTLFKALGGRV